jgi:CBS domain-containing protein
MAAPIRFLMQDQPPLVTITADATLQDAVALMLEHDFSQLPVVNGDGKPVGNPPNFITSTSIVRAMRFFGTPLEHLHVRDALIPARAVSADEDLFSKLDDLLDAYAVLVLNTDGTIAGIVTNHDTTQYFRRRAEDMLLVEDVETTLKDHIRIAYGGDASDPDGPLQAAVNAVGSPMHSVRDRCRKSFRSFCGKRDIPVTDADVAECVDKGFEASIRTRGFNDLSLSDYIDMALRSDAWKTLGPAFAIPETAFRAMLDGVRKTRNKLMHFHPDISAVERDRLRFCADWFKNHPPLMPTDAGLGALVVEQNSPAAGSDGGQAGDPAADGGSGSVLAREGEPEAKLDGLLHHLANSNPHQVHIGMAFQTLEAYLGAPLPAAAYQHRSWWSSGSAPLDSDRLLDIGWQVESVNLNQGIVHFARTRDRQRAYIRFFDEVQSRLRGVPGFPQTGASSKGANWLALISYRDRGGYLALSFARGRRLRLEWYIDVGDAAGNRQIFDAAMERREQMEQAVGAALTWEALEGKRACRTALYTPGTITDEPEALEKLVDWAVQHAPRLHAAVLQVPPVTPGSGPTRVAAGDVAQ